MFCTNCGEKFIESDQKFCQKCGATIKTMTTSKSGSQVTIMREQTSPKIPQSSMGYSQKSQMTGDVGPHSKRSLAFGITSLGFCAVGAITASSVFFMDFISGYPIVFNGIIELIVRALILVAALVFGCLARSNGNKAELLESRNGMQKAGKIMGLLGVIFSALLIGNFVLFDVFDINGFISYISGYPYYYP